MTIPAPQSERDLAETLRDTIMLVADMADDGAGIEAFDDVQVDDLHAYLTRDEGLELRFPDGSVFLLTVKQQKEATR